MSYLHSNEWVTTFHSSLTHASPTTGMICIFILWNTNGCLAECPDRSFSNLIFSWHPPKIRCVLLINKDWSVIVYMTCKIYYSISTLFVYLSYLTCSVHQFMKLSPNELMMSSDVLKGDIQNVQHSGPPGQECKTTAKHR